MIVLDLRSSPVEFVQWQAEQLANGTEQVDINDGMCIWVAARVLYNRFPEAREALEDHTALCIAEAMCELGMFAGVRNLCLKVGLEPIYGEKAMLGSMGLPVPELVE